jgi:long-chain acyl-CoA synthetase
VVLKEGVDLEEEEILHFCKKRLAPYKLPKEIERIESLPRNASGKVLKTNLRAHYRF